MPRRWHAAAARLRALLRREAASLRQGAVAHLISVLTSLLAGLVLGAITDTLERLPGLLVLVPPVLALRGNVGGVLASRLGTAIHAGIFRMSWRRESLLGQNLAAAVSLSLGLSLAFAVLAKAASVGFGVPRSISINDFVVISVVGGAVASTAVLAITLGVVNLSTRRGWDLDNVAAPLVTAAGDLVTVPSLWLASHLATIELVTPVLSAVCTLASLLMLGMGLRSPHVTTRAVVRQSFPVLTVAGLLSIAAGVSIEKRLEALVAFPAVLVLLPPFLATAGTIGGIFSSRLATKLHLGLVDPRRFRLRPLTDELAITAAMTAWAFTLVGVSSDVISALTGLASPGALEMVQVALLAGFGAAVALVAVGYAGTVWAFRLGLDPDNYAIPVVTSSLDFLGAFAVIIALLLVGVI